MSMTPEATPVKCPSCEKEDFEVHLISNLHLTPEEENIQSTAPPNSLIELNVRKYFTCVECNYVISSPDDLEMITIDVCIVGDSISGRRQGLNKIGCMLVIPEKWMESSMDALAKDGYINIKFKVSDHEERKFWVFTKSGWKRAENDPEFRLTEGQYAVNIMEMT